MVFQVLENQIQFYNDKVWHKLTLQDNHGIIHENVADWYSDDVDEYPKTIEGVIETKPNGYLNFVVYSRNHDTKYYKLTGGDESVSKI